MFKVMFKISSNRSTRHGSCVFVNFEQIWHVVLWEGFCWLWACEWQIKCFIVLIYIMHFKVRSRHSATFKINSMQHFLSITYFFVNKLHLRCCIGFELNIVTWYTKILIHFQRYFALSFLHLMSNGLNRVNISLLADCVFVKDFCAAHVN